MKKISLLALSLFFSSSLNVIAQNSIRYPVVLGKAELHELGFAFDERPGELHKFSKSCKATDSTVWLSLTPERLRSFEAKGFTFKHVCTALRLNEDPARHGFLYDPETGARLPTFVWREIKEWGEWPLAIPPCFGRRPVREHGSVWAIDLRGCDLRYSLHTGRPISSRERQALLHDGLVLDFAGGAGPEGGPPPPNSTPVRTTSSSFQTLRRDVNR